MGILDTPTTARLTEVGPRDGLQNESHILDLRTKVELIDRLAAAGCQRIEAVSFVKASAIPQMGDARELMEQVPRRPGVSYIGLVPNSHGARVAAECSMDEVAVVVSASESHNKANLNRSISQTLDEVSAVRVIADRAGIPWTGYVSTAFGCPYEGAVPVAQVLTVARRLVELGAAEIAFGDTIGTGSPTATARLIQQFRSEHPDVPLRMHFHDTLGTGLANVVAALLEGVTAFDGSVAGLGGCPYAAGATGNVASEDLVHMLEQMGVSTGVDLALLVETAKWLDGVFGRSLPGRAKAAGDLLMVNL